VIDLIVVAYNNEKIILNNVISIISNVKSDFRLIIINDCSTDNTLSELKKIREFNNNNKMKKIEIINNRYPKFETKCENNGLKKAKSKYVILLQADMFIQEFGFDQKLICAMEKYTDLLLISGRGGENLLELKEAFLASKGFQRLLNKNLLKHYYGRIFKSEKKSKQKLDKEVGIINLDIPKFLGSGSIGKIGENAQGKFSKQDLLDNKIYVCSSVIRGPLIIDLEKFKKIGFFDYRYFFQGWDDHDACFRAFDQYRWRVGFVPVQYFSDIHPKEYTQFSLKRKSFINEMMILINILKLSIFWKKSSLYKLFKEEIRLAEPEIRKF
jgi:glycosyltransferase involved in cell wall biosynthesis